MSLRKGIDFRRYFGFGRELMTRGGPKNIKTSDLSGLDDLYKEIDKLEKLKALKNTQSFAIPTANYKIELNSGLQNKVELEDPLIKATQLDRYQIIQQSSVLELEKQVNIFLENGFELVGGVSKSSFGVDRGDLYLQAVCKPKESIEKISRL